MKYNSDIVDRLYNIGNPIIRFRIDRDLRGQSVDLLDYIDYKDKLIDYWLNVYDGTQIHGSNDKAFENVIGKLLDFGFNKDNKAFDNLIGGITNSAHWTNGTSFTEQLNRTVIYPFLVRAGYLNDSKVHEFLQERIEMMERAISKYGYDLELEENEKPAIHKNKFVYKNDIATECLPTIYDLYAFAYYPKENNDLYVRIERIVEYILDERFMFLPDTGYVYDKSNHRYYASGNVYLACLRDERRLLHLYLLSFFEVSWKNATFLKEIERLNSHLNKHGFYTLDKKLIKEKKNTYQIYTGGHMGLGENRRQKNALEIESTFWMSSIFKNSERFS